MQPSAAMAANRAGITRRTSWDQLAPTETGLLPENGGNTREMHKCTMFASVCVAGLACNLSCIQKPELTLRAD